MNAEDRSRFLRPVTCAWCSNKHRSAVPDGVGSGRQGDACATHVFQATEKTQASLAQEDVTVEVGEWMAKGNYGANWLDCTLWRWVKNFPTAEAAPVCDNCIGERISADDLVQIEGNFP